MSSSLPRLVEISQVRRWLLLLGGHQKTALQAIKKSLASKTGRARLPV
jgi:hypothetical protein